jgi:hypothetical protein
LCPTAAQIRCTCASWGTSSRAPAIGTVTIAGTATITTASASAPARITAADFRSRTEIGYVAAMIRMGSTTGT